MKIVNCCFRSPRSHLIFVISRFVWPMREGRRGRWRKLPLSRGHCTRGYIAHHPWREPRFRFQVSQSVWDENSGKIWEMWPFAGASLSQLSLSLGVDLTTERARERGFSRLPTHAERLMKQSHLLHVTVPLFLALSWAKHTSYNRHPERKCFERSSRLWKLTSASAGTANTIDLDRSAIERTSQSREDSTCGKFVGNFHLLKIEPERSTATTNTVLRTNLYAKMLLPCI